MVQNCIVKYKILFINNSYTDLFNFIKIKKMDNN